MSDIYKIVPLSEVMQTVNPEADLAFDTETVGKYGKIRLAQFYQRHWQRALLVENPCPYTLFGFFTSLKSTNIVMQYASYDISTIQRQIGSHFIPHVFSDTFLLARLALPHLDSYKLDDLIREVLEYDPYNEAGIDKSEMHKARWDKVVLSPDQLLYAAMDVYYLFYLYDKVKAQSTSISYKVDYKALRCALHFQRNGMPIDGDRMVSKYAENNRLIREIGLPINANSYKQVRPYIGSDQSDDLGLARLALNGNEKALDVRETRKLLKQISFMNKFDTPDGRIYGIFAPSARSGRFTCSEQNLQQIPRALKNCFGVKEDRVLIYSDYPQLELRTIAAITGDAVLCKLLREFLDPHNYVAEFTFGKDFTADDRQVTKTENFNLLYAGGVGMLQSILLKQANVWLEQDEIRQLVRKWKRLFKGLVEWQQRGISAYNKGQLGSTPFGRKYVGRLMTDQLNIENQGFGADIAKLAMIYMYDDLVANDAKLCNFIHDSYIAETPNDPEIYKKVSKIMGEAMVEAWHEGCTMVRIKDIPMHAEVKVGFNWEDIEKGKVIWEHRYD